MTRTAPPLLRRISLPDAALFALVFGLAAYFYNGYGWNQTARYDPIWAFVEPGEHRYTLRIDGFTDSEGGLNTGDYAHNPEHSPHYYSNKAPGTSLLGIPAYFAIYHGESLVGVDPRTPRAVLVNAYLVHLWVTVLPLALSAVFFRHLVLTLTRDPRRALLLTLILYGGTLMLPFSTSLWGHTTAASFVVMALACWVGRGRGGAAWSGLLAGVAVLVDYGAAPFAASLVVVAALDPERRTRLPALALGGLAPLGVFMLYHGVLFGSPFALASSYSAAEFLDDERVMGLFGGISARALYGLTLSASRGLFVYMPVLALSLYSLRYVRQSPHRRLWGLVLANIALALLINATFNGWHGGNVAGARYQIVALPFWVLLLTLLPADRGATVALYGLAAISAANMFVVAAVSPIQFGTVRGSELLFAWTKLWGALRVDLGIDPAPVGGALSRGSIHSYPAFLMRDWPIRLTDPVIERWAVFNLGERLLGLRGVASLVPALLGAGGAAAWMMRSERGVARSRAGTTDDIASGG